jgi:hypothetical protein
VSIGFPDWQRGQHASSPVLLTDTGAIDTFFDFPAFAVSSWGFTNFLFDTTASTAFYQIGFRWNNSLTTGDFTWDDVMCFGPGQFHGVTVANRTPYCQIHAVNLNLISGKTVKVYAYGSSGLDPITTSLRNAAPLFHFNQSVAATGQILSSGFPTAPGRSTVNAANTGAEAYRVTLSYYDVGTKSFVTFWQWSAGGTNQERSVSEQVMLPPNPIQFQLINDGASAHTFIGGISVG